MNVSRIEAQFFGFATANPEAPAVEAHRRIIRYGELAERSRERAARLTGSGPVVIDVSAGLAEGLAQFFGAALAGRPACVLPPSVAATALPLALAAPDDLLIGVTSGTLGAPKAFARSHASWSASFAAADAIAPLVPGGRVGLPGPLSHSLFLFGAVHALSRGACAVDLAPFRPDALTAALPGLARLWAVPAMLVAALRVGVPENATQVWCGGAALAPETRAAWPGEIVAFYGASELSFVSYERDGSAGLFAGVRVRLTPAGRIEVASPMLARSFLGQSPFGEWVSAGDLGAWDGAQLTIAGREGRIINCKGFKIAPEPIEAALASAPGVARAAVIGTPDARRGSAVVAVIEAAGVAPRRAALAKLCRAALGPRGVPNDFRLAPALPLTPSGKVALNALAEALPGLPQLA